MSTAGLKLAVVLAGPLVLGVLGAGMAAADASTEGGHCEYRNASVNISPSWDTNGGGVTPDVIETGADLSRVRDSLSPIIEQLPR